MNLISVLFSVVLFLNNSKVFPQNTTHRDSLDRVIKKAFKGKSAKVTDMIDDSTGRTFEVYKKTSLIACLKFNRDSTTTEKHFYFIEDRLVKISVTTWNFRSRNVSFDYYYYDNGTFEANSQIEPLSREFSDSLLETSKQLYERFQLIHKK